MDRRRFVRSALTLSGLVLVILSLMIAMPLPAQAQGPAGCPDDMISYWKLDEIGSPITFEDSYGSNDGACAGTCPTPTSAGKVNGGQVFNRVSGTGINIPPDDSFNWAGTDSFSIEYWMKGIPGTTCASSGASNNEVIVGRDDGNLHVWTGCANSTGYALFVIRASGGNPVGVVTVEKAINDGNWHHVAAVHDGTSDKIYLYVDATNIGSADFTSNGDFSSASAELNLGWLDLPGGYRFSGTLDEVALYQRALSETEIKTHYYLTRGYCEVCDSPVRIMPLGNSITVGNASGVVPDDEAHWVSYRKDLWESLNDAGFSVDFVGGQSHGFAFDPPFDSEHEGHGGWTDSQIRDNVVAFLTANPADVILLHIGTNGLDSDSTQVEQILDNIDTVSEDITVVLARIINRRDGSPTTTQFNDNVEAMAQTRIITGDKIIIVDMENGAGIVYGQAPDSGDMWDNLHPYETGYAKMAGMWLDGDSYGSDGLNDFLPVCTAPTPEAPVITSDPVTGAYVGWPYSYDVEATGNPAPTFSLGGGAPSGMEIDADSGEITWTPSATGDFAVTVEATNSSGIATQNFTIHVTETPVCAVDMTYFNLDESAAPYADYLGGPDATCANCPTAITGIVGGAQQFDGLDDEVNLPDTDDQYDWAADASFTIEYWMKKDTACTGNEVIVGRDDSGTDLHWWTGCQTDGTVRFQLQDVTGNGLYLGGSGDPINDGEWHHLVFVRDESANENRIYVDGVERHQGTYDYAAGFGSPVDINIGYLNLSGHYRYDGLLDELAIHGQALTDSEIEQHYQVGLAGLTYCEHPQVAPTITSSPVTEAYVGAPYSYNVEADGYPVPTYTLTTAPTGMTIDENTGVISWTPDIVGDYDVVVEAHNTEGVDQQSFVLSVSEAPPFALRINCGGSTVVDGSITWESSASYVTGGANYTFNTSSVDTTANSIAEPIPPLDVYKACRHQSPHTYDFPTVPNGDYIVRIHWIDQVTSAGLREIDYDIEGVRVEEDWDVYAEAGGTFVAIDKEYEVTVSDGNGLQIISSAASGDAFESAIEITSRQDEVPTITSDPVTQATVGIPYSYDVEADGYPAPTYALTQNPAGMTIDSNTGVIEWMPATAGDYEVTVEASNSAGSDTQSYTINVAEAPVCPANMISYWKLDDGAGTTATDYYDGHDGSLYDAPTWTTAGVVDGALEFDGVDDRVQVDSSTDFDIPADGSFSAFLWFKKTTDCGSNQASQNEVMLDRTYPGNHGSNTWWFGCSKNSDHLVVMFFPASKANGSDDGIIESTVIVDDGEWHYGGWVYDGEANELQLYLDGELQGTDSITLTGAFDSTNPLCLGGYDVDGTCDTYEYNGVLDEVAIYNRALTLAEIQQQHQAGAGGHGYCEAPNSPPELDPIGAQSVAELSELTFTATASDADLPAQTLIFSLEDGVSGSVPDGASIDAVTGVFTWTPTEAQGPGLYTFDVVVSDGLDEDRETITVTVSEVNLAPDLAPIGDQTVVEGTELTFTATASDEDIPAQTLIFSLEDGTSGAVPDGASIDGATGVFSWTPTEAQGPNTYIFDVVVSDGIAEDWETISVMVWEGTNNPPLLDPIGDRSAVELTELSFTATATDEDLPVQTLTFSLADGVSGSVPDGASIDAVTGVFSWTPSEAQGPGQYTFDVVVSDSIDEDRETITVTVSEVNLAPELAPIGDQSVLEEQLLEFTATATDEDIPAQTLTFSLDGGTSGAVPDGASIDAATGVFSWTPTAAQGPGAYTFDVVVSDGLDEARETIEVSVLEISVCPVEMTSYHQLDESAAPYADLLGGSDATCANCPTAVTGIVDGAQQFDGLDDEVNLPDTDDQYDWAADASFTIEYWMKKDTACTGHEVIVGRDDSGTDLHWWTGCQADGTVRFQLQDVTGNGLYLGGSGDPINDGEWHHLAFVKEEGVNKNRIYVDGVQTHEGEWDYTTGFGSEVDLNIGYLNLSGHYRYDGLLDELAIYGQALTDSEIEQHYQVGLAGHSYCEGPQVAPTITSSPVTQAYVGVPYSYDAEADGYPAPTYTLTTAPTGMTIDENTGLISWTPDAVGDYAVTVEANNSAGSDTQSYTISVAEAPVCPANMISYWKLDETGTPTQFDDSYDNNPGTCSAAQCPAPGVGIINGGQVFNGSTNQIDVAADPSFDWGADDSFSIEYWVLTDAAYTCPGNDVIVGRDNGSGLHIWTGCSDSGGVAVWQLRDTSGYGGSVSGYTDLTDGSWHHVVAVRDNSTDTNNLYVDGVLEASTNMYDYQQDFDSATAALNIGWLNLGGLYRFTGTLDEIAIYSKALSGAEVVAHYNNGLAGLDYCSDEPLPPGPEIDSLSLTSSSGNDLTSDDLICSYALTGTATTIATTWYMDGTPQMLLYMPMEGNNAASALQDYSGSGNNPTNNGAAWGYGTGWDSSGGFYFNDDTILAGEILPLNGSYTKMAWVKRTGNDTLNIVSGDSGHAFWANCGSGGDALGAGHNGSWCDVQDDVNLAVNIWYHVAVSYDTDTDLFRLYRDATEVISGTSTTGDTNDQTIYVGGFGDGNEWRGYIDEVRIYDHVLSPEQIGAIHAQGIDLIVSQETDVGDVWQCQVTPFSPTEAGTTYASNSVTIQPLVGTGHITISKVTNPAAATCFSFGGDLGTFSLNDGESQGFLDQSTGDYVVTETVPSGWLLSDVTCTGGDYDIIDNGVTIHLDPDEDITCTFSNAEMVVPTCPAETVSYWKLDDGAGATAADYYDGHDGSLFDAPTWITAGVVDGALEFDGIDDRVQVDSSTDFDILADGSFSAFLWFKKTTDCGSNQGSQNEVMLDRTYPGQHGSNTWWFGCHTDDSLTIMFFPASATGEDGIIKSNVAVDDGEWHHGGWVYDGQANELRLYLDGAWQGTDAIDLQADFDSTNPLCIGGYDVDGSCDTYEYNGILDEVAIYQKALTLTEIQGDYQRGLAGLAYCERPQVAPTITSSPVIEAYVGVPYSYDVEADGYPAPTFALTQNPASMTIDPITGLIEWTPAASGDYDVTVQASNGVEPDAIQDFTIHVSAITPCPLDMSAYWKLDEISSGSYADSFADNDGVCRATGNCPVPAASGKINGAQEFSRASQLGLDIPVPGGGQDAPFDWGQNDSFSIEFWMKRDGPINGSQISDNEVIIGRDDASTQLHWWFGMWYDGVAHFQLGDKTGDSVAVDGPAIDDGRWHHLVGVRDAVNGVNYLYVDGVQYSTPKPTYSGGFDSATAALNQGWLNLNPGYYYTGLLDEVALYDRALSETEVKSHYYLTRGYCEACESPVDIMPLGDSITVGNASGVAPDDAGHWVSYRKDLWESLNDAGYSVDFVGGESHGYAVVPPFDHEHEGHGGWTDSQIRDNVVAFLSANPADVVLLHIGTNGLDPDPAQVAEILDNIDSVSEDITVVLARIINRRDGSPTTTQFNDNVEAMALARMDPASPDYTGDKIIIVDMEDGTGIVYGQAPGSGDMWDNLHPYETGYAKMANAWLHGDSLGSDGLKDILPICGPPTPTLPEIISDPVTEAFEGWPYVYDVEATGYPSPTYTLTIFPEGMTIDEETGVISWASPVLGNHDVTVEARNSEGADIQSYVIQVTEAPMCPAEIIAYYKLDENSAPYADFVRGPDATCSNCPVATTGTVNGAQDFDGDQDEVNVPDNDQFDWTATAEFSIEYWMRSTSSCSGNEVIVGRQGPTHPRPHWWTGCYDTGDQAAFILFDQNGGNGGNDNWPFSGTDITDGNWHHIVAVKDTSHIRIYVDGEEKDAVAKSYTAGFDTSTALNIGYLNLSGHYRYEGDLDEVALFNKALSPAEILQHYHNGLAGTGYCEARGAFIELDKVASAGVARVGDTVTYTYTIQNTGGVILSVTLEDDQLGPIIAAGDGVSIEAGQSIIHTATHIVQESDLSAGSIVNVATVTGTPEEGDPVTDVAIVTVQVINPSIKVVKEASTPVAGAGDVISYTYTITNTGDVFLTNLTLTDDKLGNIDLASARVADSLQVLYTFGEGDGLTVHDVSDIGTPLDLAIEDEAAVSWLTDGGLSIDSSTIVASAGAATKLINACKATNEISIEAWLRPENTTQGGPARIVTLSDGASLRNFTLAQQQDSYDTRLRTTADHITDNGIPSLTAGTVTTSGLSHVIYTRDSSGMARLYLNGGEVGHRDDITGDFSNWDSNFKFGLANEFTALRTWLGELHLVAVYNRALNQTEVSRNFAAGAHGFGLWPDESITVTVTYTVAADDGPDPIVNVATVTGTPHWGDEVTDSDSASVAVIARETGVEIEKIADNPMVVSGSAVTFTIILTNSGEVDLTAIEVIDPLVPDCENAFDSLAAGEREDYTCTPENVTVDFTNVATVTGTPPVGEVLLASDSASVDVISPTIRVNVGASVDTAHPGEVFTYTYIVENTGDVGLTNVTVSDDHQPTAVITGESLEAGKAITATALYTCTESDMPGPIINTVTAVGIPPVGVMVMDTDVASVEVASEVDYIYYLPIIFRN